MKKRTEIRKEQTSEIKKFCVEGEISSYRELFKKKKKEYISEGDQTSFEQIERREIILFNLAARVRDTYFKRCRENTKYIYKEFSKCFALFHKNTEKVSLPSFQIQDCFCDMIKISNLNMLDMKQGEVCINPSDHKPKDASPFHSSPPSQTEPIEIDLNPMTDLPPGSQRSEESLTDLPPAPKQKQEDPQFI